MCCNFVYRLPSLKCYCLFHAFYLGTLSVRGSVCVPPKAVVPSPFGSARDRKSTVHTIGLPIANTKIDDYYYSNGVPVYEFISNNLCVPATFVAFFLFRLSPLRHTHTHTHTTPLHMRRLACSQNTRVPFFLCSCSSILHITSSIKPTERRAEAHFFRENRFLPFGTRTLEMICERNGSYYSSNSIQYIFVCACAGQMATNG